MHIGTLVQVRLALVLWATVAAAPGEGQATREIQTVSPLPLPAAAADRAEPALTSADQVHRLSRAEASRGRRARIHGVVTCSWPDAGAVVVQDATRGIYIDELRSAPGAWPRVGDLLEVEGITAPGEFAPQVHAQRITRLGQGELPLPIHPAWDQLSNGSLDTQYAEIQGVVTAARAGGLTLLTPGGSLRILVFDASEAALRGATEHALICLRGVLGASWDAATHRLKVGEICIFAPEVIVDEPPPEDLFALTPKRVSELLLFDPQASALRRVKVSGQVVHQRDDETYLMDGTNGLRFVPKEHTPLTAGAFVEVVGFPSWIGPTPRLREALVRQTGQGGLPAALLVTGENLFRVEHDAVRVRVEAILLNEGADGQTLELEADLRRFVVRLDLRQGRLPTIPAGSRLELTGVYAGRGAALTPDAQFDSFELLLASPADVRVLARPAWWTWRRWLMLVTALGAVLAGALIWIRLLRHQVRERTARLQDQIRVCEHAEQQRALAQERARIARDLHDDLGSTLTEIAMLATSRAGSAVPDAEASDRLGMVAQRSRTLVHALDEIVWAVDSRRDTLASLARYLASYAEECLAGAQVACRVQIPCSFPDHCVPGQVRHQLFLAVKEALNNAVRHGGPSEVVFRLRLLEDRVAIALSDNGRGFDPTARPDGNGLRNLRDRLRSLGGRCEVESAPGRGATVSFEIPLPVPEPTP